MSSILHEPWFECDVKQRFNDNQQGFIHGQYTTGSVFNGSRPTTVNVGALELSGKYITECPFSVKNAELVAESSFDEFFSNYVPTYDLFDDDSYPPFDRRQLESQSRQLDIDLILVETDAKPTLTLPPMIVDLSHEEL